jgi:hypothetical protein
VGHPPLPFTTVEDDLDMAPAPNLPEQILVPMRATTKISTGFFLAFPGSESLAAL